MSTNPSDALDIEQLMSRIKEQIHAELGRSSERFPRPSAKVAQFSKGDSSPVLYAEELNYLNANWRPWAERVSLTTHRPFLGKIFLRGKEYILHLVWDIFFAEYFRREEEYQKHLVRYLNKVARYIDARDADLFWQLVEKVDSDVSMVNAKGDRLYDELAVTIERLEAKIELLEARQK